MLIDRGVKKMSTNKGKYSRKTKGLAVGVSRTKEGSDGGFCLRLL